MMTLLPHQRAMGPRAASTVFPGSQLRADLAAFLANQSKIESKNRAMNIHMLDGFD